MPISTKHKKRQLLLEAITFDLWNTLIISNHAFKQRQARLFSDFLEVSTDTLSPILHYLDKELDKKAEKTGLQTNFDERIQLLAQKLACNLPENTLSELYTAQESLFLEHLPHPSEETVGKLLDMLTDKGVKIFLIPWPPSCLWKLWPLKF